MAAQCKALLTPSPHTSSQGKLRIFCHCIALIQDHQLEFGTAGTRMFMRLSRAKAVCDVHVVADAEPSPENCPCADKVLYLLTHNADASVI